METKNLLKSLKRRLGLITAILAMLAVSQGALAAWLGNSGVTINDTWYKTTGDGSNGSIDSGNWLASETAFKGANLGTFAPSDNLTIGASYETYDNSQEDNCNWNKSGIGVYCRVTNSSGTVVIAETHLYMYHQKKSGNNNIWETNGGSSCGSPASWGTKNISLSTLGAGTYYLQIRFVSPSSVNYPSSYNTTERASFKIEIPCTTPVKDDFTVTNNTKTYNGSGQTATVTGKTGMGTITAKYGGSASQTNVGEYSITVSVAAGSTYCAASDIALDDKFKITKADQSALTFSGSTQCVGNSVTLSATGGSSGQTIKYTKKSGTGTVSGSTLTTDTAGDVVVTATCPGGTNYNDVTKDATFTFVAKPTAYAVSGTATICTGNSTNVTLANSQTGYTYKLYKGGSATSTTKTGTGSALNFSVSEAGTYTVKGYVTGNESCSTDMSGNAVITVNQNMALTSISPSSASECIGGTSTITPSGLNLGGGSISYTSSNTSVASVSGTTITAKSAGTVTITGIVSGGCGSNVSKTASFTVKPSNAINSITFTKSPLKISETCSATADYTTSGGTGSWSADGTYATITAGGVVTGKAIGTATITYTITGGCGTSPLSKNASLEIITNCESPTAGSIGGTTSICAGNGTTLTLSGQSTGTNLQWYKSTDGSSYTAVSGATGTSLSTGTLNANAYYKVRVSRTDDASCYSETTPVTVTVTAIPTITTHTDNSRCGTGTVTLSATASAGDVKWYSASTGGTFLKTGTSYTTPSISTTTTYYVDATQNGCTTATRTAVTATVNTVPSISSIAASTEDSGCGAGTVKFTASGVSAGSTIHWYENSTKKGEGNTYNYNDVAAGSSVTLKAKAVHTNDCESEFTDTTTGTRKALPSLTTAPAGSAVTAYLWEPVNLTATTTDGTATVAISTSSTKYEVTDITNGKSLKAGKENDTFTVTYTATSTNGCQTQEVKTVTAEKATEDCSK